MRFERIFGELKPVIAMVHLQALPGTPLYNRQTGIAGILEAARRDLIALQHAGFDAVLFGNENDRPYELEVDIAATATMASVIGQLRTQITVPFGVNVLWDAMSSMALGAATGAAFIREILTGTYASDMGLWNPNAGQALRYRSRLGCEELAVFYNVSAEFAHSLDRRSLADRARSVAFSSIPDAILVSGNITGEPAALAEIDAVKKVLPHLPVLANTGVKHETVLEVLRVADGCIVGSSLKVDGMTFNPVDPARAREFMRLVKGCRHG